MSKEILSFNIEPKPRPDYYVTTNIKGVESYAPPAETLRFLSDLKKSELLYKHQDKAAYRAQLGIAMIDNLVQSMAMFDGEMGTLQLQYLEAAERKYRGQPFSAECAKSYWGAVGEYSAQRLFELLDSQSEFGFQFDKASPEEDARGIDAWVTPDASLPEFQSASGNTVRLATAVKHIPNIPYEINDFIYPLRDEHDLDVVLNSLGADLRSYSAQGYSIHQLMECRADLGRAATKAFQRFQGCIPNSRDEGSWRKVGPSIDEVYGDAVVPSLLLVSQNRKQQGEPLVSENDIYTLESQLADNPDKWS